MLDPNVLREDLDELLQSFIASQPFLGKLTDARVKSMSQSVELLKVLIRKEGYNA
jgi:hypothetical protein